MAINNCNVLQGRHLAHGTADSLEKLLKIGAKSVTAVSWAADSSLEAVLDGIADGLEAERLRALAGESYVMSNASTDRASIRAEFAAADAALQADVDQNEADADAAIAAEGARALAAETYLTNQISAQGVSDAAARAAIQADVDQNESDADAAILGEKTRAEAAEVALGGRIDDVLSNTDPAALDSLTEVVSAFQAADGNLSSAITAALGTHTSELTAHVAVHAAYVASNDTALAAEVAARGASDAAMQADIDQNESDADAAIAAEATARAAADNSLTADLGSEASARASADSALDGRVSALETEEGKLDNDLYVVKGDGGNGYLAGEFAFHFGIDAPQMIMSLDASGNADVCFKKKVA